jgi:hypothetical protein
MLLEKSEPILQKKNEKLKLIRRAIWIYFYLLIFEGALRKWVLPGLATPLIIIRDPIALWILFYAYKNNFFPKSNPYIFLSYVITILSFVFTLLVGHKNVFVGLYGARILLIHFPLIFIIGRVFNRNDVVQMGRITMMLAIPMAILIGIQFYSPQTAWVNRGVGGDEGGAGFGGALGFFRPPGTFSFTNGNSAFFSIVSAYLFYFWLNSKEINKIILIGATIAFIAAIAFSISRTIFFQAAVGAAFTLVGVINRPKYLGRVLIGFIGIILFVTILSSFEFYNVATDAFNARFENANKTEGGVQSVFLDRFLGGAISAVVNSTQFPFWGVGLGMGTGVGSMILTGKVTFLVSEGEWGRIIGEMGPLFGIIVALMRVVLSLKITRYAYKIMLKKDWLPWMLLSYAFFIIIQGGWAQPTNLGFFVIIGGLVISSIRHSNAKAYLI